jgi:Na+/proline symporter
MVIIYTVAGGTKAVSVTQKQQMGVIFLGMFIAFYLILDGFPDGITFGKALEVAGASGKMNVIDFSLDVKNRYTIWSGLTGGLFLALAYFGTDQSQVQRYLSGRSVKESRLGLLFNGLLKVPMQFFILLVGVMVFVFFQFTKPPVFFNDYAKNIVYESPLGGDMERVEQIHEEVFNSKKDHIDHYLSAKESGNKAQEEISRSAIQLSDERAKHLKIVTQAYISEVDENAETNDKDYVFITFIMNYLPHGLIGLLLAVIFSAAMSSTAAELNALASTTCIDFYKRSVYQAGTDNS